MKSVRNLTLSLAAILIMLLTACDSSFRSGNKSVPQQSSNQAYALERKAPLNAKMKPEDGLVRDEKPHGDTTATDKEFNTEDYDNIVENKFLAVTQNPLST